jgi:hypothetical protein
MKAISEFGPEESEIHSLNNLISLCQICHAGQHLGNHMLAVRASHSSSRDRNWPSSSVKRSSQERFSNIKRRTFSRPAVIAVHPSSDASFHYSSGQEAQETRPNSNAKSISGGLAWIDKRIADMRFQDGTRRSTEEDIYSNCDYCDKEILVNPAYMSARGKYLCDDCYSTTGGKE